MSFWTVSSNDPDCDDSTTHQLFLLLIILLIVQLDCKTRNAQGSITMAFIFTTTKKSLNIDLPLSFQPLLPLLLQLNRVPKGSHCWPRGELSANESFWPVWNMFLFYQTQNQAQNMTLLCIWKWIEYFVDVIYITLKFPSRILTDFLFSGTYRSYCISNIFFRCNLTLMIQLLSTFWNHFKPLVSNQYK